MPTNAGVLTEGERAPFVRHFGFPLVAALLGLTASAWFFRGFWQSGFQLTQGDDIDGRVIVLQVIQWWRPFAFGSPLDVGIFYPAPATLGTTDGLFLFGLGSWPLSFLFSTPQVAVQAFLILLSLGSYTLWLYFLRRQLNIQRALAVTGALLLTFGHPIYVISGNFKMLTIWLLPVPIVLVALSLRAPTTVKRVSFGLGAGIAMGLIALTSIVVVWFIALAGVIIGFLWLLIGVATPSATREAIRGITRSLPYVLAGAALTIPILLVIYLPNLDGTGAATSGTGFALAIRLLELFNVSDTNLVWGGLYSDIPQDVIRSNISSTLREWQLVPTPLVMVTGLLGLIVGAVNIRRATPVEHLGLASLITGFGFWLLPVRDFIPLPTGGSVFLFPWAWLQHVPGADGIRYISRFEIFAFMLIVLGTILVVSPPLTRFQQGTKRRMALGVVLSLVLLLMVLEQINLRPMQETNVDRWNTLNAIPPPPASCTSFAVMNEFPDDGHTWETMNDARAIAWLHGIPTVNGFSSVSPQNWDVDRVREDSYLDRLTDWIELNSLDDVCLLDLNEGTWQGFNY